ncbi:hypothetical protein GCM10009779_01030 [Polymorphospora rubra]
MESCVDGGCVRSEEFVRPIPVLWDHLLVFGAGGMLTVLVRLTRPAIGRCTGPVDRPARRPDTTVPPHSEFAVRTPNSLWTATPTRRPSSATARAPVIICCPAVRHAVPTTAEQLTITTHRHVTKGTPF